MVTPGFSLRVPEGHFSYSDQISRISEFATPDTIRQSAGIKRFLEQD